MPCSRALDGCRILALAIPRDPPYFCVVPLIESCEPSGPDTFTLAIRPKGAPFSLIPLLDHFCDSFHAFSDRFIDLGRILAACLCDSRLAAATTTADFSSF